MEMSARQARTIAALAEAFCYDDHEVDVWKEQGPQAGWLKVRITSHVFLVDPTGVPRHVEDRSAFSFGR